MRRQEERGWGAKVIDQLARDLKEEGHRGFSARNLRYMRAFARNWPDIAILQTPSAQITWSHHKVLLDKLADPEIRLWYAEFAGAHCWSVRMLKHQIATQLHLRQGGGWRTAAVARADRHGIFEGEVEGTYGRNERGTARARYRGETAVPFSLKPVKDFYQPPFGAPVG